LVKDNNRLSGRLAGKMEAAVGSFEVQLGEQNPSCGVAMAEIHNVGNDSPESRSITTRREDINNDSTVD
jgi:hypothetical protein